MQIHEIAEGDEGSSEDGFEDGDDCCEEDEKEEAMVHELAGELFEGRGGKMRINSVRSSFKDDEHNLLFDLEEDTGGSLLLTIFKWTVRNNYVLMT